MKKPDIFNHSKGEWKFMAEGEANQYMILSNPETWLAAIKQNGGYPVAEQKANMKLFCIAPQLLKFFGDIDWKDLQEQRELLNILGEKASVLESIALSHINQLLDRMEQTAILVIGYSSIDIEGMNREENQPIDSMAMLLESIKTKNNIVWDEYNEMQQKAVLQGLIENNYGFAVLTEKAHELYPHLKNIK